MPDAIDTNDADGIGDFIDDPVVAYTNAPVVDGPGQFATTRRPGIMRQSLNGRNDALVNGRRQPFQVPFRRTGE